MKLLLHLFSMIGVPPYVVMSKRNFLLIFQHIEVSLHKILGANLHHDLVTGRDMSGIIHLVNPTPIASYCKKQKTVETATYGSEFMISCHASKKIMDIQYTL